MHSGAIDLDVINHDMRYLFEEYGFIVMREVMYSAFGNWQLVLESSQCGKIQFAEDRGQIFVSFGPRDWPPRGAESGPWHDLGDVASYVSEGAGQFGMDAVWFDGAEMAPSDNQLRRLAVVLRHLMPRIREVFGGDKYFEMRAQFERGKCD